MVLLKNFQPSDEFVDQRSMSWRISWFVLRNLDLNTDDIAFVLCLKSKI